MENSKQGRIKNEKDDSTLLCKSPAFKEETERIVGNDTVDTPKTKKSKLFDTPQGGIVLHRNYNFWQNTPGVHIQRALYELEPVVFSPMNIRSLLKERQREVPKVELLKFLEAVGDCDTKMDFEETRCMSDLVAPLQLANIANGRTMKDVRLEFGLGTRWPLPCKGGLVARRSLTTVPKQGWSTGDSFSISLLPVRSCIV